MYSECFLCKADQTSRDCVHGVFVWSKSNQPWLCVHGECLCAKQVKPAKTLCMVSLCKASQTSHDFVCMVSVFVQSRSNQPWLRAWCLCAKQVNPAMTVYVASVFVQSRLNQPWLCAWCLCVKQVKPAMTVCVASVFVQSRSNQLWLNVCMVNVFVQSRSNQPWLCVHGECLCAKQVKPAMTLWAWWVSLCKAGQTSHDFVCMVNVFVQSRSNQPGFFVCLRSFKLCASHVELQLCVGGNLCVCVCVCVCDVFCKLGMVQDLFVFLWILC